MQWHEPDGVAILAPDERPDAAAQDSPVILESAALSGMDAFEEVIILDDLTELGDPFRDRLHALARQHAPGAL